MPFNVIILYPSGDDAKLDLEYYNDRHMPLVKKYYTKHGLKSYTVTEFGPGAPYLIAATLVWGKGEELQTAAATSEGKEIMDDIANFYNKEPLFLTGDEVASG